MIAGLTRPDDALITFDGTVWNDTGKRIFVPPHRRRIGYVFQEGRLFPHMTARQNLLYGRFFSPKAERSISENEVVDLLGIQRLLDQRPATLSGGEKQRVAIGRALLSAPRLILMDEPLSALDRARRQEILPYIERIRDVVKIPVIYVSHALDEVARLANRVVLLDEGRVRAEGAPVEIFPELSSLIDSIAPQSVLEARMVGQEEYYGLSIAEIGDTVVTLQPIDLPEGTVVRVRVAEARKYQCSEPSSRHHRRDHAGRPLYVDRDGLLWPALDVAHHASLMRAIGPCAGFGRLCAVQGCHRGQRQRLSRRCVGGRRTVFGLRVRIRRQPVEIGFQRLHRLLFHGAEAPEQFLAERGQCRAPTPLAAMLGLHDALLEHAVEFIDEQPAAPVGHVHARRRLPDRAGLADQFHKLGLAVA